MTPKKQCLQDTRWIIYEFIETILVQDLHRFKPDKISGLEREKEAKSHSYPRSCFQLIPSERRKSFIYNGVLLGIITTLQGRPYTKSSQQTQKGLYGFCCFVFLCLCVQESFAFFWIFFVLLVSFLLFVFFQLFCLFIFESNRKKKESMKLCEQEDRNDLGGVGREEITLKLCCTSTVSYSLKTIDLHCSDYRKICYCEGWSSLHFISISPTSNPI